MLHPVAETTKAGPAVIELQAERTEVTLTVSFMKVRSVSGSVHGSVTPISRSAVKSCSIVPAAYTFGEPKVLDVPSL